MTNTTYHQNRLEARSTKREMPYRYVFILTNLCNLRCSFCFQEKKYLPGSIDSTKWIEIIKSLPSGSHITLTGGEPLLFKDFEKILDAIHSDITFNIITNGLLLNKETSARLLKHNSFKGISISIDDIGNKSRDFTDSQWEDLMDNIKSFKELRDNLTEESSQPYLDIKTVVHGGNQENILEMAQYSNNNIKPNTHMFMLIKGSPIQHSDTMYAYSEIFSEPEYAPEYDMHKLQDKIDELHNFVNSQNVSVKYFLHPKIHDFYKDESIEDLSSYIDVEIHDPNIFADCRAPWESVHINNDGNVFPCLAFSVGNIKQESIYEIINSDKMNSFKAKLEECGTLPACKQCGYLQKR